MDKLSICMLGMVVWAWWFGSAAMLAVLKQGAVLRSAIIRQLLVSIGHQQMYVTFNFEPGLREGLSVDGKQDKHLHLAD